jgi:phosphoribosylanthranilate isomerase
MIAGTRLKICGLTALAEAALADACGADYLGFILWPQSPRAVSLDRFRALRAQLPLGKAVAVYVLPTVEDLRAFAAAGADRFQIHFPATAPLELVRAWSETVGPERLWLAPKLPPSDDLDPALLPLADTFLLDTYQADKYGGTGRTGDWEKFARHQRAHPAKTWILSGGLNPENIIDALRQSGAKFVDVNSGVESSPGVKDPAKLKRLVDRLNESRT